MNSVRGWRSSAGGCALLAVTTALVLGACQDTAAEAEVTEERAAPDTAASDPTLRTEPLDSVRVLRAWLVNSQSRLVIVDARAGAGQVFVDSLMSRDSARVNLEVRADSVQLTTRTAEGRELGAKWLRTSPDSVTRLELP